MNPTGRKANYRIGKINGNRLDTIVKFYAENDAEAIEKLKSFVAENNYNIDEYAYDTANGYLSMNEDGSKSEFDSMDEMMRSWTHDSKLEKIWDWIKYHLYQKWIDHWRSFKKLIYLIRTKHSKHEWYCLDGHIIEDLLFNLPKLISDRYGFPGFMIEKAKEKLGDTSSDDNIPESVNDEANNMWTAMLEELLLNVRLYVLYREFGIVSEDDGIPKDFIEKYKDTIPYKPYTNKSIDYVELEKLVTRHWNFIWDWVKQYGQSLWD